MDVTAQHDARVQAVHEVPDPRRADLLAAGNRVQNAAWGFVDHQNVARAGDVWPAERDAVDYHWIRPAQLPLGANPRSLRRVVHVSGNGQNRERKCQQVQRFGPGARMCQIPREHDHVGPQLTDEGADTSDAVVPAVLVCTGEDAHSDGCSDGDVRLPPYNNGT